MRYFLFIDSSTLVTSISLIATREDSLVIDTLTGSAEELAANFQTLLGKNNLTLSAIQFIAVVEGPGSYTGLRVGASFAKGISFGSKLPIVALSKLEAYTIGMTFEKEKAIIALKAREGEYFTLQYKNAMWVDFVWKISAEEKLPEATIYTNDPSFFTLRSTTIIEINQPSLEQYTTLALKKISRNEVEDAFTFHPKYMKEVYLVK